MSKKKILIDVDGVFANFADYYLDYLNFVFETNYKYEDITDFDMEKSLELNDFQKFIMDRWRSKPGIASNLSVDQDVVDTIILLDAISDVYFLTSHLSSNPTWVYERDLWLQHHFGPNLGRKVIYTKHKQAVTGDIFIDDCYENIVKWAEYNPKGAAYLWTAPWNVNAKWNKRLTLQDFKRLQQELLNNF
jgi:5'(3')-deoxyribonucleotidase